MHITVQNSCEMHDMWMHEDVEAAVEALKSGGIILYPTDTIWGLGCDASNEESIKKIYGLKRRPEDKPLILLVDGIEMLKEYAADVHPRIETLLSLHERPLTVVYRKVKGLPGILYAQGSTVAIRIVMDSFCKEMIRTFGGPIVSTSANLSGTPYPAHFGEIDQAVINGVDYVVKHRQDEHIPGTPSVVATFNAKGQLDFLRD